MTTFTLTLIELQKTVEEVRELLNSPDGSVSIKLAFVPDHTKTYVLTLAVHYDPNNGDLENYHIQYHDYTYKQMLELKFEDIKEKLLDMAQKIFYTLECKRPHLKVLK